MNRETIVINQDGINNITSYIDNINEMIDGNNNFLKTQKIIFITKKQLNSLLETEESKIDLLKNIFKNIKKIENDIKYINFIGDIDNNRITYSQYIKGYKQLIEETINLLEKNKGYIPENDYRTDLNKLIVDMENITNRTTQLDYYFFEKIIDESEEIRSKIRKYKKLIKLN